MFPNSIFSFSAVSHTININQKLAVTYNNSNNDILLAKSFEFTLYPNGISHILWSNSIFNWFSWRKKNKKQITNREINVYSSELSIFVWNLFQLAATDSNRPTNCMRFSGTRSQTFHSMTSSAITKSGSSSRLSHRVVNNTVASDDAVDISVQTDQEQLPPPPQPLPSQHTEPQGNHW